ncbi:MAG TPA: TetR/AcrR family transcriptional regulator [Polyangia bacterium]
MATQRDGEHTKARLRTEARDLYLDGGFAGFSLREVARRAGVSAAAVYRHFDDKEALLRDVCAAGFAIFSSYLLRALAARTPRERMAAAAEQYLRFALENPRDYRFIFMGAAEDRATLAPVETAESASTFHFLVDRVRECMQVHVLQKGDPQAIAASIWAHVHGLCSLRLSGHFAGQGSDEEFARFYHAATHQLLAGLAP